MEDEVHDYSLKGAANSNFVSKTRFFTNEPDVERIKVFVEGDDDVSYWEQVFKQYVDKKNLRFEVTTNKMSADTESEANGKACLLNMAGLGFNKIICVDADLDLLVDDYSEFSQSIRDSRYIISTTYYSIENILMNESFHASLLCKLGLRPDEEAYHNMLSNISTWFYEPFLLLLSNAKRPDAERGYWFGNFASDLNKVSMNEWAQIGAVPDVVLNRPNLHPTPEDKMEKDFMEERIHELGFSKDDCWKLMRGHSLVDIVYFKWVNSLFNSYVSRQIENFKHEHTPEEVSRYKKELYQSLGNFKSTAEAVRYAFYHNTEMGCFVPQKTLDKIIALYI